MVPLVGLEKKSARVIAIRVKKSGSGECDTAAQMNPVRSVEPGKAPSALRHWHHCDITRTCSAVDDRVGECFDVVSDDIELVACYGSCIVQRENAILRECRCRKDTSSSSSNRNRFVAIGKIQRSIVRTTPDPSAGSTTPARRSNDVDSIVVQHAVKGPRKRIGSKFQDDRIPLGSRRRRLLPKLCSRRVDKRGLTLRGEYSGRERHDGSV
jgi:hypothetical protein